VGLSSRRVGRWVWPGNARPLADMKIYRMVAKKMRAGVLSRERAPRLLEDIRLVKTW